MSKRETDDATTASGARARADRCSPEEADRRLRVVLDLFATGQWSNAQAKRLGAEWGLTLRSVREYSRMAAKILGTTDLEDVEELRADTIVKLGALHDEAKDAGEYRSAVAALAERAKVAGIVTLHHEHSGTVRHEFATESADHLLEMAPPSPAALTDAEAAEVRALSPRLRAALLVGLWATSDAWREWVDGGAWQDAKALPMGDEEEPSE